jgi:hypothetical protein
MYTAVAPSMSAPTSTARPRRGRPPKFGRPAQLVTMTLPDDVVAKLKQMGPDLAWAVVKLCERAARQDRRNGESRPVADLVQLPGRRALILVQPDVFKNIPGVAVISLADGRGFLALEAGRGAADLEVSVLDRLDAPGVPDREREALLTVRALLRQWRQEGIRFHARSLIVAERSPEGYAPAPLVELNTQGE